MVTTNLKTPCKDIYASVKRIRNNVDLMSIPKLPRVNMFFVMDKQQFFSLFRIKYRALLKVYIRRIRPAVNPHGSNIRYGILQRYYSTLEEVGFY